MKRFADIWRNERGVTLVELLAAVTLTVIVSTLLYGVFAAGIRTYEKIEREGRLRDEADYIVSRLMSELYSADYDDVQYDEASQSLSFYSRRQVSFRKDDVAYTYTPAGTPAAKLYINNGSMLLEEQTISGQRVLRLQDSTDVQLQEGSSLNMVCTRQKTAFAADGSSASLCENGIVRLTLVFQMAGTKQLTIQSEIGF